MKNTVMRPLQCAGEDALPQERAVVDALTDRGVDNRPL